MKKSATKWDDPEGRVYRQMEQHKDSEMKWAGSDWVDMGVRSAAYEAKMNEEIFAEATWLLSF